MEARKAKDIEEINKIYSEAQELSKLKLQEKKSVELASKKKFEVEEKENRRKEFEKLKQEFGD